MGTGKLLGKPDKLRVSNLRWTSIPSREAPAAMSQSWLQRFTHFINSKQTLVNFGRGHALLDISVHLLLNAFSPYYISSEEKDRL